MGGLYGSEYWTYLMPGRVGAEKAGELTSAPFTPVGTREAVDVGLIDAAYGATLAEFRALTRDRAQQLAAGPDLGRLLEDKRRRRARDEQVKPLQAYRTQELARSHRSFVRENSTYHEARRRFVYKLGPACAVTPAASPAQVAPVRQLRRA